MNNRLRTLAGFAVTTAVISVYYQSCGAEKLELEGSQVLAPVIQPRPAHRERLLGCATKHTASSRSWKDPITGKQESRIYRKSDDVDYLSNGWENRVASSYTYLTPAHTGESPERLRMIIVDVRTVDGVPHYHYYGNATPQIPTHVRALEPWSSSKVYGVAMAFHRLRFESNGRVGGNSVINGGTRIDEDMDVLNDVSSNLLAGFYKALAGRRLATAMIKNWVKRPGETFGGFYGDSTFATNQTFTFRAPDGFSRAFTLRNDEFTSNSLSPLTLVEMIKRLGVGFKDAQLLPKMVDYAANPSAETIKQAAVSLKPEDLDTLFYGTYRNGLGGMMYDGLRDIPHNMGGSQNLDNLTGGRWRAFGKGGSGFSTSRNKDEESTGDWVCVPGQNGSEGLEFAIYAHIEGPNKVARLHAAIKKATQSLFPEHWAAVNKAGR